MVETAGGSGITLVHDLLFAAVSSGVLIRPELPDDYPSIGEVNRAAFGGPLEAALVERLRADGLVIASLVAVNAGGQLIAHILFSPVDVVTSGGNDVRVASLAPMAVLPAHQRRGVGSMLVKAGIEACREARYGAIVLVGHPAFYPRFGFSHALVASVENPFAHGDAFMGLELRPGVLTGLEGRVVYPEAFSVFE